MKRVFEDLEPKEWLELNAKLQSKKNALRLSLKEKGVLKKGGSNDFDHYKYFSEAQYKELFTELFSANKLELSFDELEYNTFSGSERQANGRMPKLQFILTDVETGFYEVTAITGEGIDKGDKAGYKAYTGALKYYLANTFMVATGDDPESESPAQTMNKKNVKASKKQIDIIKTLVEDIEGMLQYYGVSKLEDLTSDQANEVIKVKSKGANNDKRGN